MASKHTLPKLPYAYDALEPYISKQIMELHHQKHHQTYVTNLNAAEEKLANAVQAGDVKTSIALQAAIKFNGGGHINHSLFWENLAPASGAGGKAPTGPLGDAIEAEFGGLDKFKAAFNAALASIQGSGWGWLVQDASSKKLKVTTTPNQDPITGDTVIIGVDAWEHAYYLQYENAKVKYFEAIWSVINWEAAGKRYQS
ncbi:putative manganese superoxide dismutase precursor [Protomyces lactucae-debilis]|uniref:Superoxide dismutase n=1 Tax=Protomyces lactucae-debilis TaxID=2754530 RepID=A0A1Y2F0R0_PROLT|nr:putative manganese superoxide dismutase precursor [Protomyces lactucae-debilis]ORY77297.1 putative manganese superoxide dismutase precursor [Protomyces lactucae-debilis]